MEMGFSKIVSEKALFMTKAQGGTTETGLQWIDEHSEDPDFNEELRIVGQTESAPKSTLTKEERIAKAKALQEEIRRKRAAEEKRLQEEQEKNRVKYAKEMSEMKRKVEEQ